MELIVLTSNLKKSIKKDVSDYVVALQGTMLDVWKPICTTIVVKEILLTPKVLIGIIFGKPIVTPKYFFDFVMNVKQNRIPPVIKDYEPPCGESILPQHRISLEYNPDRKMLFTNKVFVFFSKAIWNHMTDLIEAAGKFFYCTNQSLNHST